MGRRRRFKSACAPGRLLAADQCTGQSNVQTRDALRAFQKREGLPATGLPSYETVEHLGLELDTIFRSTTHAEAPPRRDCFTAVTDDALPEARRPATVARLSSAAASSPPPRRSSIERHR